MKVRVEKKLLTEVLKAVALGGSRPMIPAVKVVADTHGVLMTGMNEGGTILSGAFLKAKPGVVEVLDKGTAYIDLTELSVGKMKSDMVTLTVKDQRLHIDGPGEHYEVEALLDNLVLPMEFTSDGKTLKLSKDIGFTVKATLTEFDEIPVQVPTVILKADGKKVKLIAEGQISKYEREFHLESAEGQEELWLDYDYFTTIAKSLKKSDLIDLWFNDTLLLAKGIKEWGEQAYILVGKEKEV